MLIGRWTLLADGTWGVRVSGKARVGSIITVRFADRREPRVATVAAVVEDDGATTLCRIEGARA
jgi:hypothetical protein